MVTTLMVIILIQAQSRGRLFVVTKSMKFLEWLKEHTLKLEWGTSC